MAASTAASAMSSSRLYAESQSLTVSSGSALARSIFSANSSVGRYRGRSLRITCHSEPSGGCCGGSGSGSSSSANGSSCSSHGRNSLSNLGKEFEHLVATNTLLEFEKEYVSAPMNGNITRDVIESVMDSDPDETRTGGERFLDINEIVREAKCMSHGDMIFSDNPDFVLV